MFRALPCPAFEFRDQPPILASQKIVPEWGETDWHPFKSWFFKMTFHGFHNITCVMIYNFKYFLQKIEEDKLEKHFERTKAMAY